MAKVICPSCAKKLSSNDVECKYCGFDIEEESRFGDSSLNFLDDQAEYGKFLDDDNKETLMSGYKTNHSKGGVTSKIGTKLGNTLKFGSINKLVKYVILGISVYVLYGFLVDVLKLVFTIVLNSNIL